MMQRISTSPEPGRFSTMQIGRFPFVLFGMALVAMISAGCASNNAPVEQDPGDTSEFSSEPPPSTPSTRGTADTSVSNQSLSIPPVYFNLDDSSVRDEFADGLRAGSVILRETGAQITIEGHCDERGSDEYNVALGERRANAVRTYLYNLGVPNGQMNAVSYGEAQPAVSGSGETAWQLNRRAQFTFR